MDTSTPQTIYLKDYTPSAFLIQAIELDIAIHIDHTLVTGQLRVQRNPAAGNPNAPLILNGEELSLESLTIDGTKLGENRYTLDKEALTIPDVPDNFVLTTICRIKPQENTQLMGLYASQDGYFTQCEAEGFRRITFFIDRPDVMARYTVTIRADKEKYPVLLSNGNLVDSGLDPSTPDRHWAKWEDPFPKPSYLFAMVAAKLDLLEDSFVTRSGKHAKLSIYVSPGKLDQADFAMLALKKAMKWDEDVFGLELDLDQYMIVAVDDFNMGAMENKGLNIFNTKYVLARPDTATDIDYQNIDRVVAHEYFHNWTGNRVTCRDWFQLSLKEGLTVFRDQEFGADMYSRPVQRIREVRGLRAAQFPEDAGPMAHPVRPQSYMEISNFYTSTVYEKGAEVVRMIHTLIGAKNFRKGMDLYFQRHDGQAVTTEDFVQAMADASGADFTQFKRWYDQAGTPVLSAEESYDAAEKSYTLKFKQSCPNPLKPDSYQAPFHIPLAVGLINANGEALPLQIEGDNTAQDTTRVLSINEAAQSFKFLNIPARPVPSLARDFSAPIIVKYRYSDEQLTHLMAHDSDPFNRWEAGQQLATQLMLKGIEAIRVGNSFDIPPSFVDAFAKVLKNAAHDPAFTAEALTFPAEGYLAEQMDVVDPDAIHNVRITLLRHVAQQLKETFTETYHATNVSGKYQPDAVSAGRRALRNLCLGYLAETAESDIFRLVFRHFELADNMTDSLAALAILANFDCPERQQSLAAFYAKWKNESLVIDKWLRAQAVSRLPGTIDHVSELTTHPAFSIKNPNKVYSLIGAFGMSNPVHFHAADGRGYRFLATQVIALDQRNPQVAARMARAFDRWRKFDTHRQQHAQAALESIRSASELSKDVAEIVTKALQSVK